MVSGSTGFVPRSKYKRGRHDFRSHTRHGTAQALNDQACQVRSVQLLTKRCAAAAQVLEQALGQSVAASAEAGQLWVSRATQPAGAPLSEVWRAAAVLDVLPQHLAWLADVLMVRSTCSH